MKRFGANTHGKIVVFLGSKFSRHPGSIINGFAVRVFEIFAFETPCQKCLWSRSTKNQELVLLCRRDKENVCRGHGCSRIVCSQRLLRKNLFRKVPLFVSQSIAIHFAKYRLPFRKVQIFNSQSTYFHFAKHRLPFRKVQISFRFVKYHFAKYSTPLPSSISNGATLASSVNHFLHFRIQEYLLLHMSNL